MTRLIRSGFVGEFDPDNFDEVAVRILLVFFILVVMIVFLNVLIAIVSDSYDLSMAKAEGLFLRSRCELITETALIASLLPTRCLPTHDEATIKASLTYALAKATRAADDDPNRLNYTINARRPRLCHVDGALPRPRNPAAGRRGHRGQPNAEAGGRALSNKTGAGRDEGHAPSPRRQGRRAPRPPSEAHRLMNH